MKALIFALLVACIVATVKASESEDAHLMMTALVLADQMDDMPMSDAMFLRRIGRAFRGIGKVWKKKKN